MFLNAKGGEQLLHTKLEEYQATLRRLNQPARQAVYELGKIELQFALDDEIDKTIHLLEAATLMLENNASRDIIDRMVELTAKSERDEISRRYRKKKVPGPTSWWTTEKDAELLTLFRNREADETREEVAYRFRRMYPDYPLGHSSNGIIKREGESDDAYKKRLRDFEPRQERSIYKHLGEVLRNERKEKFYYELFAEILG
ncbi:hypothetical protein LJR251_000291 [Rhizobium rhizogenes]|uniref:hypothetical protein n=1 Tax=Rhizobium rhizogenes TaxID=359 RepID=UPI003ED0BB8A